MPRPSAGIYSLPNMPVLIVLTSRRFLLSPGDTVLIVESGYFSESWAKMAGDLGLEVQTVAADWRRVLTALAEGRDDEVT